MSNFLSSNSTKVSVNGKKPNYKNDIQLNISDIPNLQTSLTSLATGTISLKTATGAVLIGNAPPPTQNQSLVAVNDSLATWQTLDHNNLNNKGINSHLEIDTFLSSKNNANGLCALDSNSKVSTSNLPQIDHTTLSNVGTNTHTQIDTHITNTTTFMNSKAQPSGIASLDSNGKLPVGQVPSIALTSVNTVSTIAERNALTVQSGDVCVVTADTTPSNNGSYIYNGTSWVTFSLTITGQSVDNLLDVVISTPINNQILKYDTATSKWINGSLSSSNLSDVLFSNLANNDILRYNGTKFINSNTLTIAESNIEDLKTKTDVSKTTSVVGNDTIVTSYNDDLPNQMIYVDNRNPYMYPEVMSLNYSTLSSGSSLIMSGNSIKPSTASDTGWNMSSNSFKKINLTFNEAIKVSKVYLETIYIGTTAGDITISVYGSNNVSDYNDLTANITGLILLGTGHNNATETITTDTTNSYKYLIIKLETFSNNGVFKVQSTSKFQIERTGGTYRAMVLNTDYLITSDPTTGAPKIGFITGGSSVSYNLDRIQLYECYRRLYKTVIDSNTLRLTNGNYYVTLTTPTLSSNLTLSLPSTTGTSGQILRTDGSGNLSWITPTGGSTSLSGLTTDVLITTPSTNQLLQYNGTKWVNATVSSATALSALTDCTITTPSTNQLLQYNGTKWVNATISTGGSTTLAGLTGDVNISTPATGNLLIYNSSTSKWVNSDSIPDNLLFVYDDGDTTKKLQFQLSGITSGQTRVLTIPDASTTIVGTDATQTLTNKTLTDSTNNIMAKSLKSATTTVDVGSATAPNTNQVLKATSPTTATWQTLTLNTASISDVVVTSPSQYQILQYNGVNWVNANNSTFLSNSQLTGLAQNSTYLTSYSNSSAFITGQTVSGVIQNNPNSYANQSIGTFLANPAPYNTSLIGYVQITSPWTLSSKSDYFIISYYYTTPTQLSFCQAYSAQASISMSWFNTAYYWVDAFAVYGSNHLSSDSDKHDYTTSGGTLLFEELSYNTNYTNTSIYSADVDKGTTQNSHPIPYKTFVLANTAQYRAYHFVVKKVRNYVGAVVTSGSGASYLVACYVPLSANIINGDLIKDTDFTISTDTTGAPKLTILRSGLTTFTVNLNSMLVEEAYRRLFPVVRDTNTINLTDGVSNTLTITSTSNTATALKSATTTINVSSATAPTSGQVLTATSGTTATWQNISSAMFNPQYITYVKPSDFANGTVDGLARNIYTMDNVASAFVIDITNTWTPIAGNIYLPNYTGNLQMFYMQVRGTQGSVPQTYFISQVMYGAVHEVIYTASNTSVFGFVPIQDHTYWCIHYTAGNNDWYTSDLTRSSWKILDMGLNVPITLNTTVTHYIVNSTNGAVSGTFYLPSVQNGSQFYILDKNGFINTSTFTLTSTSGTNTIENNTSLAINGNRSYLYIGDGTVGNVYKLN